MLDGRRKLETKEPMKSNVATTWMLQMVQSGGVFQDTGRRWPQQSSEALRRRLISPGVISRHHITSEKIVTPRGNCRKSA